MKMSWPDLGVTKTEEAISDKVKAKLKVAVDAAREYEVDRGERRLGLVVVVPEIPAREWNSEQKRRDAVSSFVRAMASVRPAADFVDWCVPKHHEMFPKCRGDYYEEAYFYPAIGVAGKRT
jgi:hypothetical protein